jgi:hypothetical protein
MNVYTYIVECNPNEAYEICKKYGFFNIESKEEMAKCLETIIANEGEGAFKEMMELHPDKEVIVELFTEKKNELAPPPAPVMVEAPKQVSADGSLTLNATGPNGLVNQTNTYILVAALIISVAIISMKK